VRILRYKQNESYRDSKNEYIRFLSNLFFLNFVHINQKMHTTVITFAIAFFKNIKLLHVSDLTGPTSGNTATGVLQKISFVFCAKVPSVKLEHLVGFITKKSVTMHGHMNVKLTTDRHISSRRDSNSKSQQASGRRPTP